MKENKYDEDAFFLKYSQMDRSRLGLSAAGEWETLERLLPDFRGARLLDLGCGYGWHCVYAMEHGAASAVGVDISRKMLAAARERTKCAGVEYVCAAMEDVDFPDGSFDAALSSLALHYVAAYGAVVEKVYRLLRPGGRFVFSAEHPVFTSAGPQDWCLGADGTKKHFPVDRYFEEGERRANFLGEPVVKYHRTLTTYLNTLLEAGFRLEAVVEPMPPRRLLDAVPDMRDELRRPMMLLVSAVK